MFRMFSDGVLDLVDLGVLRFISQNVQIDGVLIFVMSLISQFHSSGIHD